MQLGGEMRERFGEAGEEQHHHEDQPHVVGFPDRTNRLGNERPLLVAVLPAREEIPYSATEVGTAKQNVCIERQHHHAGHHMRQCPGELRGVTHVCASDRSGAAEAPLSIEGMGSSPVRSIGVGVIPVLRICRQRRNTTAIARPM